MYSFFYYMLIYLALGALGMYIANKKVNVTVRRQRWLKYFTYVIITGIVAAAIFLNFFIWLACAIVAAGFVEILLVNFKGEKRFSILSIIIYAIISAGFIVFSLSFTKQAILFIYFQVLLFDAFGQIIGQLFGKNLLVPEISPTKTIEGLIGGWLICIVSAMLGSEWVGLPFAQALLFGLLTGFTAFWGDLLASWFKRIKNIKDYSNWLPGQGGFLDRFDSFIFTGACYYVIGILFETRFK